MPPGRPLLPHPHPARGRNRTARNGGDRRRREGQDYDDRREVRESLLHRKYVIPFLLACIILACNQLTGINSIISYNATILIQAGLSDKAGSLWLRHPHHGELS